MPDPHIKKYFSFSPKITSVLALTLALIGHLYFLHRISTGKLLTAKTNNSSLNVSVISFDSTVSGNAKAPHVIPFILEEPTKIPAEKDFSLLAPSTIGIPTSPKTDEIYYYKSNELTSKPQVITDLPDEFALPALTGVAEPLIVTLRINKEGTIDDVIIDSDIANEDALQKIVTAFKTMRFTSGQILDKAVYSEMRIVVSRNPEE